MPLPDASMTDHRDQSGPRGRFGAFLISLGEDVPMYEIRMTPEGRVEEELDLVRDATI